MPYLARTHENFAFMPDLTSPGCQEKPGPEQGRAGLEN